MDLKLISKNNVATVATLFLVVILSHASFFDFLVDTALGRAILILFILGISYTNKILGVVSVLFIIIFINNSDLGYLYLEGFSNSPNITENKTNMDDTAKNTANDTANDNANTTANDTANDTANTAANDTANDTGNVNETKGKSNGIEGFNIIEREHMMIRGKRSNEVPIYSNARNQDDVEPTDNTLFVGNYSPV